jgi:hypothetical protein
MSDNEIKKKKSERYNLINHSKIWKNTGVPDNLR